MKRSGLGALGVQTSQSGRPINKAPSRRVSIILKIPRFSVKRHGQSTGLAFARHWVRADNAL
jgi:hypothetical protein